MHWFPSTPLTELIFIFRHVAIQDLQTGTTFVDVADVVISARGTLNEISWPNIQGLSDLTIPVMHSAAWDSR
jgi:cation diffusion facilitator CzcD-associated flavoprotein CzcO